ncbi:fungal specific transcription factor domain protein [Phaffia rhodozyma]|uniref:Fungal specific transcription factor domain protein n=1 Tax=Phaffia rhodozyma TaxID=264483 RepID=A0A0F7SER9_PHARH|nr:fungal specific transcription factor domain protein [Phaffia rhodozyma]
MLILDLFRFVFFALAGYILNDCFERYSCCTERGARACVACRKGKNRCEGLLNADNTIEPPCRRCELAGVPCVFEKPPKKKKKTATTTIGEDIGEREERVSKLEDEVSKISEAQGSMQSTLSQILSVLTNNRQGASIDSPATSTSDTLPYYTQRGHSASLIHPPPIINTDQDSLTIFSSRGANNSMYLQSDPGPELSSANPFGTLSNISSARNTFNSPLSGPQLGNVNQAPWNTLRASPGRGTYADNPTAPSSSQWPPTSTSAGYGAGRAGTDHPLPGLPLSHSRNTVFDVIEEDGVEEHRRSRRESDRRGKTEEMANDDSGERGRSEPKNRNPGRSRSRIESAEGTNIAGAGIENTGEQESFPALPGFAPPPTHRFAPYEIVPSTAVSSDDESENTLPRAAMMTPGLALQGLANAAADAANGTLNSSRVVKKKRVPPPPNPFPDVVTKGMVSEAEARELYNIFFSGSNLFVPLFDPAYDTFESLRDRTPFTVDVILAVAAKIRGGNGPLGPSFRAASDEAHGIARSTLFGPVVRKEAVQASLLLACYSQNGYLPSGHAVRMSLDIGLHRALSKLLQAAGQGERIRSDAEERDLVVSTRIWLTCFWYDRVQTLSSGKPTMIREDDTGVINARHFLSHPMSSPTDVRLVAEVELVVLKTRAYDHLQTIKGQVTKPTLSYISRVSEDLNRWYTEWDDMHKQTYSEESVMRNMLLVELHYAKLWLVCVALRGASWDKMPYEQKEIALEAKESAMRCLEVYLNNNQLRAALCFAIHEYLVMATFSACYLIKVAILFPNDVDRRQIVSIVSQLAGLLSEISAERYSLTLGLQISTFKRRYNMTRPPTPSSLAHALLNSSSGGDHPGGSKASQPSNRSRSHSHSHNDVENEVDWDLPDFDWLDMPTMPDFDVPWLTDDGVVNLGLPVGGSESLFFPFDLPNLTATDINFVWNTGAPSGF